MVRPASHINILVIPHSQHGDKTLENRVGYFMDTHQMFVCMVFAAAGVVGARSLVSAELIMP